MIQKNNRTTLVLQNRTVLFVANRVTERSGCRIRYYNVVLAAVGAGSAITILTEITVPEWLRIISPPSPLPPLGGARIQLLENPGRQSEAVQTVKREIVAAYGSD